jgi:UTP--glucose-1-phosphate uridylyltransferase
VPCVTKAVIPVAGMGSRLAPLGLGVDKAMLPVGGTPLLSRVVGEAIEAGLCELIVVVGPHNSSEIGLWLDGLAWGSPNGPAFTLTVAVQTEPRGLGDALLLCKPFVGAEPFAVLLPDNVFWGDTSPAQSLMRAMDVAGEHLVGLIEVDEGTAPWFSVSGLCRAVSIGNDLYRVEQLQGKGPGRLSVGGPRLKTCGRQIYLPDMWPILEGMTASSGEELDDVGLLQTLAQTGRLVGARLRGTLFDVGNPDGYRAACRYAWEHDLWWR